MTGDKSVQTKKSECKSRSLTSIHGRRDWVQDDSKRNTPAGSQRYKGNGEDAARNPVLRYKCAGWSNSRSLDYDPRQSEYDGRVKDARVSARDYSRNGKARALLGAGRLLQRRSGG